MSTTSAKNPTTSTARSHAAARPLARAILSTLDHASAAMVLVALAGLARAIVEAAAMLRHTDGPSAQRMVDASLASGLDPFNALVNDRAQDLSPHAYALAASWWFSTPCEVVAAFQSSADARPHLERESRGVLSEVEALREALASSVVRDAALPAGVDRLDAGGFSWRRTSERVTDAPVENIREHLTRHGLETALRSDAPVAARVLRVEAPPFASASKGVAASIGRALYFADPSVDGFADAASGLAGLTSELACSTDAAGLVAGLAQIAAHHAARGVEARTAQDASAYLGRAAEALDAARGAARLTLDALDAAPPSTGTGDVKVRAA